MWWKIIGMISVVFFVIAGVSGCEMGKNKEQPSIPKKWTDQKQKKEMIKKVLKDTNKVKWLDDLESADLKIYEADLTGDGQKEIALLVSIGPKNSLIAVYKKKEDDFEYLGTVDTFFAVKQIQMIPIEKTKKELIVVREFVDQMIGAFEQSTFIRAYLWDGKKFEMVLTIMENYKGYWNELWDKGKKKDARWLRVMQKANIQWENGPYPVLSILKQQTYAESKTIDSVEPPPDDDFEVIKAREVAEQYFWSPKWNHFILREGKDKKTGETIAILEDLSLDPFQLAGYEQNEYRIKRSNGKIEVIPKNQVMEEKNPLEKLEDSFMGIYIPIF